MIFFIKKKYFACLKHEIFCAVRGTETGPSFPFQFQSSVTSSPWVDSPVISRSGNGPISEHTKSGSTCLSSLRSSLYIFSLLLNE